MNWLTRALLLAAVVVAIPGQRVQAETKLPAVIGSQMVMQRDQPVPIWGWATPGENIVVRFADSESESRADETGQWRVTLPKLAASAKPRKMTITDSGRSQIELTDILVGEVWFCTGPSNIFWQVKKCDNAAEEIHAAKFPQIRFFSVKKKAANEPQSDCVGNWFGCSPDTVGDVSGVGYFFSRRIHQDVNVSVGLLQSFWGGSRIEAWTSREALEAEPAITPILDWWKEEYRTFKPAEVRAIRKERLDEWKKAVAPAKSNGSPKPRRPALPSNPHTSQHRPACIYNGMVAPLIPFSIRGVICYQGLGNLFWAEKNAVLIETLILDWRSRWAQGNFPVGMVQPTPYDCSTWRRSGPHAYSIQREAQLIVYERVANTGIAPTLDIDALNSLHFTNKQLVGRRLSSWALATVYDLDLPYAGPLYDSMTVEGDSIHIRFQHTGNGLMTSDEHPPRHFEIAGVDQKYHPATARIDGHAVVISSQQVAEPVAARFAFLDTAVVNLTSGEGLPASLFRTEKVAPTQATRNR